MLFPGDLVAFLKAEVTRQNSDLARRMEMPDREEVLRTALSLSVQDRASLAEKLLASLDELSEEEAERLWTDEAERRLREYRAGRAKGVSADQVSQKAQRLLG